MAGMAQREVPGSVQPGQLLPAGHRWGTGVDSITPYLRDAWAMQPRNPVFTPRQLAALAWPANTRRSHPATRKRSGA